MWGLPEWLDLSKWFGFLEHLLEDLKRTNSISTFCPVFFTKVTKLVKHSALLFDSVEKLT